MLEVSLWHQGLIVWQLSLIEATLPVVEFMLFVVDPLPERRKAVSTDPAFSSLLTVDSILNTVLV